MDESQEKTTIAFRFHNGQRAQIDLNLTHKISDLHSYIQSVAPVDGSYELVTGFPPKILEDPEKTIGEANLKRA